MVGGSAKTAEKKIPAPKSEVPAVESMTMTTFQAQLRNDFVATLPATLVSLRTLLQALIRAENETGRVKQIQELYRRTHSAEQQRGHCRRG